MISALALLTVACLSYLTGAWTAWVSTFPFDPIVRQAFAGATSIFMQQVAPKHEFASDVWMKRDHSPAGVVTHVQEQADDGYTLVTIGQQALLLDMDGTVVHRWSFPYDQLSMAAPAAAGPEVPDTWIYWRPAKLFPNGDLLALVDAWASTPEGLALIKLDRRSRLIWTYHANVHHDFDIDDAGNIYILGQEIRFDRPPQLPVLQEPYLDESVIVLSPEGRELRQISIMDAFAGSDYRKMVNRLARNEARRRGDYLHTNNAEIVSAGLARRFSFLEEGQVILSMRELDTIAALDLDSGRIVWAARGSWHRQHDPDLLDNGNIMLFDNLGDWARGGRSRVIEFDPRNGHIIWTYPSSDNGELWSRYRAEQQSLTNGNVLINEFLQGRLLEVTRDGEVVWEFLSPFRNERDNSYVARIMFSARYPRDWIAFDTAQFLRNAEGEQRGK